MELKNIETPLIVSKEFTEVAAQNLKKLLNSTDYTQNSLAQKLKEFGLLVNQGTINKYLTGQLKVPLSVMVKLCEIFNISISDLVNKDFTYADEYISTNSDSINKIDKRDSALVIPRLGEKFITNPNDKDFHGYLQKYFCYFFPTLPNEKNIISGVLELYEGMSICEAKMIVNTNKFSKGKEIQKNYSGCAIISNSVQTCYIILSSPEEGEICVINFRHFFIRHQNLDCRMAEVITNGAGERHFPTIHRMLLSKEELKQQHINMLLPHLHLNCSDIRISKEDLDRLTIENEHYGDLVTHLIHRISPKEVYDFKEEYVYSSAKQFLPKEESLVFLSKMRGKSYKMRYNKVSNKLDETVHNLLLSLGYFSNDDNQYFEASDYGSNK